jgi:hypothetical protein
MGRRLGGADALNRARQDLAKATTADKLRRAQAVVLPNDHGLSLEKTAEALGRSAGWVSRQRGLYARNLPVPEKVGRGGRRNEIFSQEEEERLVRDVLIHPHTMYIGAAKAVRKEMEERLGKPVATSTLYKVLSRAADRILPGSTAGDLHRLHDLLIWNSQPKLSNSFGGGTFPGTYIKGMT